MSDITIGYKGSTIASMNSSGTKILSTAGTWLEDDITIDYSRASMLVTETLDEHGGTIVTITGDTVNLQTKSVTPTASTQVLAPDSGYNGFASVVVNGDQNLISSNIINGASIFGINGTGAAWETAPESWATGLVDGTLSGSVYGSMVLKINTWAFYECSNLTGVSFSNCKYINQSAFQRCYSLTTASFPKCISVGYSAFESCHSLNNIFFPNCTVISAYAFCRCSNLTNASFPKCVTIEQTAFQNCINLSSIYFPKCTSIGNYAFYSCNLSSIYFPACTQIGNSAFTNCSNLVSAFFPNCITIYYNAFQSCTSLTTISFPNCIIDYGGFSDCIKLENVSFPKCISIAGYAFYNCTNLKSAYFLNTVVPSLGTSAFYNTPILDSSYLGYYGSIYVLSSMVDKFKSATNWAAISSRIFAFEV